MVQRGENMLVAVTDQNKRFVVKTSIPPTTLKKIRESTQFFCPQCKEPLQFKIGNIKIPHFAHYSRSTCEAYFSEGESEQHLLGKEQLLNFFQSFPLQVELEPFLPVVQQRPDLLVQKDNKKYAIEFQCSPITLERLIERNDGYKSLNILPIWIPLTKDAHIKQGICKVSLSEQLQQFIQTSHEQQYIMSYHPNNKKFYYLSNLLHVQKNTYLSKIISMSPSFQQFPFYVPKRLNKSEFMQYVYAYNSIKERYLLSRVLISRQGVNDFFLRSIYELRLDLQSLPPFLGVPLVGNESLQIFSVEWQTLLFYFIQINRLSIESLNSQTIHYFLKWARLPETNRAFSTVVAYVAILQLLNIKNVYSSVPLKLVTDALYSQFLANEVES